MKLRTHVTGPGLALAAAFALIATPAARAHDAPNGVYVEAGGGIEYWSIPAVEGIVSLFPTVDEIGNTDGSFWAETGYMAVGFVDGDGTRFPDPLGRDARIEARVRWAQGDSDRSADVIAPLGFFQINNPPAGPNGGIIIGPSQAYYETELETWEADLLYRTDVPFSDALIFTPFAGLTYAYLDIENDFTIFSMGFDLSDTFSLDDEIESHFLGVALGADAELRPIDLISFRAGVRADLMGVSSKLEANQNFFDGFIFGTQRRNAETDRDLDFAARVGANLGMAVHLGNFEIGVDGNVRYHSYLPTAEHPTASTHRTSHVGNRSAWTASAMARVSILFD